MSTTLTLTANKSAAVTKAWGGSNVHSGDIFNLPWYKFSDNTNYAYYDIFVGFASAASSYRFRPITSGQLNLTFNGSNAIGRMYLHTLAESFSEESVSYDNEPATSEVYSVASKAFTSAVSLQSWAQVLESAAIKNILSYGLRLQSGFSKDLSTQDAAFLLCSSRHATTPPTLAITFGDADAVPVAINTTPAAAAVVNRAAPILFAADVSHGSAITIEQLAPTSATLQYRKKSASSYSTATATVSGTSAACTLPANTLTDSGAYEFRFVGTTNSGASFTTAWQEFSSVDTIPVATPLSPDSSLEDGTQAIAFRWMHNNESGSAQTKAELQKSADGSTWTTLGIVTGAANEYAAPAGTFTSGTWYWRVRTYNLDGAAGEWSDALSFVVVAGPTKPVIVVKDASPRPLINWQTSEQSAYQLQLDDIIDHTEYGSEKTWHCPVYLDDGAHTFRVRSQNSYGLWSEWGSATFTVSHTASGAVVLTVDADHRAELSWSYAGSWTEFVVYRDGVAIAKTTDYSYTDDYSVGTVRYQVRVCASDGTYNYSLSNEVTVSVMPETVMLSALGSGKWLFLRLSTAQHRTNTIKASRTFSLTHLSGRKFPEAELTEFCDRSISVSYATDDEAEKAALEALMGSPVCLKTPGGKMVIGILDTLSETESMFYSSYNFAVSQMHYPEEVDLDA